MATIGEVAPIASVPRPQNLNELAYREILNQIVSGKLSVGTIYSAGRFADMLKVSRSPVREALLQLAAEGYLVFLDGRGFRMREFSRKEIKDIFETRMVIEGYIVGRLAGKLPQDDFQQLQSSIQRMTVCAERNDAAGFLEADKEFHMILVHRHHNLQLLSIMENIRNYVCIFGLKTVAHAGRMPEVIEEHTRIVGALTEKNKTAAIRAMRDHLTTTAHYLLDENPTTTA